MRDTERNSIQFFRRRETAQFEHLARREHTAGFVKLDGLLFANHTTLNPYVTRRVFTPG